MAHSFLFILFAVAAAATTTNGNSLNTAPRKENLGSVSSITNEQQRQRQLQQEQEQQQRRTKLVEFDFEVCPQVPSLHCKNGSTCTPGTANFGQQHDHLDLQDQESGYYCACKDGYIGHECQIRVDECGDEVDDDDFEWEHAPSHSDADTPVANCYNGAKCRTNSARNYCDCTQPNSQSGATDAKFAGAMCQFQSTSMCAVSLVGTHAPNHQFCTNHGECVKLVTSGEPHPGCRCKKGWSGDHCEIQRDVFSPNQGVGLNEAQGQEVGMSNGVKAMLSLGVIAAVSILSFVIISFVRKSRNEKDAANNEAVIFQHTKDVDPDGSSTLSGMSNPLGEGGAVDEDEPLGSPEKSMPANTDHSQLLEADGSSTMPKFGILSDDEDETKEGDETVKLETEIV